MAIQTPTKSYSYFLAQYPVPSPGAPIPPQQAGQKLGNPGRVRPVELNRSDAN